MQPSALRQRLSKGLLDFAWDEWAQMGVLAAPQRRSPWAQDPEALLIFTLEVARDDPRLFDEILDWLTTNEALLSVRRLRALCEGREDRQLVEAALGWLAQFRPRARLTPRTERDPTVPDEPLFRNLSARVQQPDPAFAAVGLLRPLARPAGAARVPDMRAPINLAFRLRQFLGISARAEVIRYILTAEDAVSARSITLAAGFAKRNVHEALLSLHSSGVVTLLGSGREQRYAVDRESWMRLLRVDPGELPSQQPEWLPLLTGTRAVLRWLSQGNVADLSHYLLGSQARDLLEGVRSHFEQAGIPVGHGSAADAWRQLEALVDRALRMLGVAHDLHVAAEDARPGPPPRSVALYVDAAGHHRWRLRAVDGVAVATSGGSFTSKSNARRAAEAFLAGATNWRYEVYADASGQYRWRAKASNGETIAASGESFASLHAAERAVEGVQHVAGRARV